MLRSVSPSGEACTLRPYTVDGCRYPPSRYTCKKKKKKRIKHIQETVHVLVTANILSLIRDY